MDDLRDQIERLRGPQLPLSPEGAFPVEPVVTAPPAASPTTRWMIAAIVCAALAVLGWILFKLVLNSSAQGVVSDIMAP
jgi:type VI protein secretion system component VasF